MTWRVPLFDLDYGEAEAQAALAVLASGWLTMGAATQTFEAEFAERCGVRHAIAVANATAALHLACCALDIGPGDEVIVPSLTFVATANAVLYTGATIRFADIIGSHDLTIAPASIEAQITPQTKAIIVMHYAGYPCQMRAIADIGSRHGLAIIEDAAHAPGASLHNRSLGTWGDIGCFSFFSNKNLSTGEGGMLITDRDDVATTIRTMRSHGMTSVTLDRHKGHAFSYDVVALGYNYRIDEIHAALGSVQLRKLAANNAKRRALTARYRETLANVVNIPFATAEGDAACHILPVLLPPHVVRAAFMTQMRQQGIQTSIHYPPVHQFSYYRRRYPDVNLPHTEAVGQREVTLPLYPTMTQEATMAVVDAVHVALEAANRVEASTHV